jgi:hypothetical protein
MQELLILSCCNSMCQITLLIGRERINIMGYVSNDNRTEENCKFNFGAEVLSVALLLHVNKQVIY